MGGYPPVEHPNRGRDLKHLAENDPRLAWPLYTLSDAARHLDVPVSTLHYWAHPDKGKAPLITTFHKGGTRATMPFVGFAEAFVIKVAVDAGVPRHKVRPGVEAVKEKFHGIDYALAHQCVYTDGAEILYRTLAEDEGADLTVAHTDQKQFRATIEHQLKLVTYATDGFAERVRLAKYRAKVVADPRVAGGAPVVARGGARVKDLLDRFRAGDSEGQLADDFGVPLKAVKEVVGAA